MFVFWLAVSGGFLNGLGVLTCFTALESGDKASIVISLIALYPLLIVTFGVVVLHEQLTMKHGLGAFLALIAAIVLANEPKGSETGK